MVNIDELNSETIAKLGLSKEQYNANQLMEKKLVAMGKVLTVISSLTNKDALWVLRTIIRHITGRGESRGGYKPRKDKTRCPKCGSRMIRENDIDDGLVLKCPSCGVKKPLTKGR